MTLTNERAELLAKYLTENTDRTKALLELSPEEAVVAINSDGNDFTVDEVAAFGEQLKISASQVGELDADSLDAVSGGLAAAAAAVYLTCVTIGVGLGTAAASNWKW